MGGKPFRLAAGAATIVTAGFFLWILTGFGGETATHVFDDSIMIVASLVASLACRRAARLHRGAMHRAWFLLFLATLCWTLGEITWAVYEIGLRREVPFPSLADVWYLAAPVLAGAGMLSFPSSPARLASRVRTTLDSLLVVGSLFYISWATVLGPLFRSQSGGVLEQAVGAAYPLSDVALAVIAIVAASHARRADRMPLIILGAALVIFAVSDSGYSYVTLTASYSSGYLFDVGWLVSYLLIALSALRAAPSPVTLERSSTVIGYRSGRAERILPYVLIVPTLAVAVAQRAGRLDAFEIWTSVIVALIISRHGLAFIERSGLEKQLVHQALHDPLTGLANRALFHDRLDHALARSDRSGAPVGLLIADVDNFKSINDSWGHGVGDRLLAAVATRLKGIARETDTVARLGGDEFAILLEDLADPADAQHVAGRLLSAFDAPFSLDGEPVASSVSIGVAVAGAGDGRSDTERFEELLRNADVAMYVAKGRGRGRYELFEPGMHAAVVDRLQLGADLQRAVKQGEFHVLYQPVVSLRTGRVAGVEALLRWNHPTRGLLRPEVFISAAEDSGLLLPIGWQALGEACAQARRWQREIPGLQLGVNLSAGQLRDPDLVSQVSRALGESQLPPESLLVEINEGAAMAAEPDGSETLRRLKRLGLRIAIDNFGTGYSSLNYLRRLPVSTLKIDQSLVGRICDGPEESALARAIVKLGHTLGLRIVATGIESPAQLQELRQIGCDLGQGRQLAEPLSIEMADAMVRLEAGAATDGLAPMLGSPLSIAG